MNPLDNIGKHLQNQQDNLTQGLNSQRDQMSNIRSTLEELLEVLQIEYRMLLLYYNSYF